ncbi:hypothetical protein E2C01_074158 [Portunus trituberculatus]|uniref:Uncharacterized protein n=1 Tax=Portunus trituberculatus TaxID=210409 RepID=A0A5B7I7C0_PORTR|nr:hypothetical protein [Portunus trituberculatus]
MLKYLLWATSLSCIAREQAVLNQGLEGLGSRRGTVDPWVLRGPRGFQAHGFESYPRSECRLSFLTWGNDFLAGGL